jgi:hypothetical protein
MKQEEEKIPSKRERDERNAREEAGLEAEAKDAKRYRYLRNNVRSGDGSINEQLYVRCDGRRDGRWALDGAELDIALDLLLVGPDAPVKAKAKAEEAK